MRKLLLATVAVVGVGVCVAEDVQAQTFPTPGTVTVRLNGRFRFFAAIVNDRDTENNLAGSPNGATPQSGGNKLANYGFASYARLYPGFDGVAANGLKYGASLEIRQDLASGAGGGTYGSISTQSRARGALAFRRAWGYLGTDKIGTVRFGTTDQPSSLYMTGNFENFNDGGWNGDIFLQVAPAAQTTWPFADQGENYTTTKVVYLSPQFFGFDFGASYEPNSGGVNINSNCGAGGPLGANFVTPGGPVPIAVPSTTPGGVTAFSGAAGANSSGVAGPGCDRLSSTPVGGELTRRRNTFDGLVRYRGIFGGFGIAATAGYITGGSVQDSSTPARAVQFEGLNIGDFGVALTYGGASIGGKYQFGRFNGRWTPEPRGAPDGEAWLVGASYTLGPVIIGASYFDYKSTGDVTQGLAGRERHETGLNAGGTYSLAPGVSLFLTYLYGERRQNGFNFVRGLSGDFTAHNKVTAQVFSLGTALAW